MTTRLERVPAATGTRPLAVPAVPAADASTRVLEDPKTDGVKADRVKPPSQAHVPATDGDAVKERHAGFRTEVLSLAMLAVAVMILVQLGVVSWALDAYAWSKSEYFLKELAQDEYNWMFVQPGHALLVSFLAAVILVGKEFLVQRKVITLTVNAAAAICGVCLGALYVLNSVQGAILDSLAP